LVSEVWVIRDTSCLALQLRLPPIEFSL